MPSIEKIRAYLNEHGSGKATDIALSLGCSRGAVNSILYYNKDIFNKNLFNEWELVVITENLHGHAVQEVLVKEYGPERSIFVKNIDLVERITELLKKHSSLSVRTIADHLGEPRSEITRRLHSFQSIFERTDDNVWSAKLGYTSNVAGQDSDFSAPKESDEDDLLLSPKIKENYNLSQKAVIEANLDRNFLVLASPGTGKTHTLVERLVYTITKSLKNVDAGELLVLSFTRAAVAEIRERIAAAIGNGAPSSLRYVQVKTFDAYATWLLNDGGYDIAEKNYDSRILLLTKELENVSLRQLTARIDKSRYLFIDEIQDLVGVRADMVFELTKRVLSSKGSVTLLGDPHQSLNEYQIGFGQTDSSEFLAKVKNLLIENLEYLELKESHRYETAEMKNLAVQAKEILDNVGLSPKDKFDALVHLIPKVSQAKLIESFKISAIDALLCRSNREVYQWLNWHQRQGNQCSVNAGAIGRPWPDWIGRAIIHYQSEVITRDQLINRLLPILKEDHAPSIAEVDEFLINEHLVRHNVIHLEELANRIKYSSPAKKGDYSESGLIVSTVHKAKGLEYKNVVVVEPNIDRRTGGDSVTDEQVRVLYVAITRAKRTISMLAKSDTPFNGRIKKKRGGHFGYMEAGVKYLQVIGLEDFDLETLFIDEQGGVDASNLENYLLTYQKENNYSVRPESCNAENDHNYALYLNSSYGPVRLCFVGEKMKESLDAMAWGNKYGEAGALLDIGEVRNFQTIVHTMQSPILTRFLGPAGIMVLPIIQGFYPLSRATGD